MCLPGEQGKAADNPSVCNKPVASSELFFEFYIVALQVERLQRKFATIHSTLAQQQQGKVDLASASSVAGSQCDLISTCSTLLCACLCIVLDCRAFILGFALCMNCCLAAFIHSMHKLSWDKCRSFLDRATFCKCAGKSGGKQTFQKG